MGNVIEMDSSPQEATQQWVGDKIVVGLKEVIEQTLRERHAGNAELISVSCDLHDDLITFTIKVHQ